jgi:phosphodiesterase/alkaline phosphatase D-like protein
MVLHIFLKQIKNFVSLLLILGFISSCKEAQPEKGLVKGVVLEAQTNLPIQGALVSLSTYSNILTNSGGKYSFNIEEGEYALQVSKEGFNTQYKDITVNSGDTTVCNFLLDFATIVITLNPEKNIVERTEAQIFITITTDSIITCYYGTNPDHLTDTASVEITPTFAYTLLQNLVPGTLYYYRFRVLNTFSNTGQFTTVRFPAPMILTGAASDITNNSAIISGAVNPNGAPTNVLFKYGTSVNYTDSIFVSNTTFKGSTSISVYAQLNNLQANTIYHFCLKAYNEDNGVTANDMIFITQTK